MVMDLEPDDHRSYSKMGIALMLIGDINKSLQFFDIAIDLSPEDPNLFVDRGTSFSRKGDLSSSILKELYLILMKLLDWNQLMDGLLQIEE